MTFVKGSPKPPNSGRKKGTKNVGSLLRVEPYCLEKGIEPLDEVVKLLPELKADVQVKVWLELLSYYQAKPKPEGDLSGSDVASFAELLKLLPDWARALIVQAASKGQQSEDS